MKKIAMNNILDKRVINLKLRSKNKKDILHELSEMFFNAGYISNIDEYLKDVYLREKAGITGMGNNVAIPHGKSKSVKKPGIAIGRTSTLIEWETYDDQPVNLFFLFAVPDTIDSGQVHLKLLAELATKLADDSLLTNLKSAKNTDEFCLLLE